MSLMLLVGLVATVNAAGSTWKDHMARRAHEIHLQQATDMELYVALPQLSPHRNIMLICVLC